jgi:hypothetical protein
VIEIASEQAVESHAVFRPFAAIRNVGLLAIARARLASIEIGDACSLPTRQGLMAPVLCRGKNSKKQELAGQVPISRGRHA